MKKTLKLGAAIFLAAVTAFILCLTAFGVWDNENTHYCCYERSEEETCFEWVADTFSKRAMIVNIEDYDGSTPFLPSSVRLYDDESELYTEYTVTDIKLKPSEDDYTKSIFIPSSVTSIEGVGFWQDWDSFWDSDYYWDESGKNEPDIQKIPGFTICCVKGSYAETYAKQNGFSVRYLSDITKADIKLSAASFYFDFYNDIEPEVTITLDGKALVKNKDFTVEYENNCRIGTACVNISGIGDYVGNIKKTFSITKIPAKEISVALDENEVEYTGYKRCPYLTVKYKDCYLDEGYDYTVTYSNNTLPGTATVKLTFIGDIYTGTKTATFKIVVPAVSYPGIEANADASVTLYWSWHGEKEPERYNIYRYNADKKKYEYIGKSKSIYSGFTDKKTAQLTKYTYRIVPVISEKDGKKYNGKPVTLSVTTPLFQPTVTGALYKKSIKLTWEKNAKADGYIIYRRTVKKTSLSGRKKLATVSKNSKRTFTDTTINPKYTYYYTVCAYKKIGSKTYYSLDGSYCQSNTPSTILAGAQLKKRTSFKIYNTQGSKTTYYTYTISERDQKVLKKFAEKHFKKGMSREEKLRYTLNWINKKVTYAVGNDWNKISGKGFADAIFTYRLGQCVQYNGAMAEMMAYLGYDAYLIQGYRGDYSAGRYWQHFWCEVKINGRVYLMETGNYGCDGNWSYFLTPYSETSGYIKNKKNIGYR